jgi:hypothetical protein
MALVKPLFTPQRTEEERANDKSDVINVRLNASEIAILKECQKFLMQEKDSTALKQLAFIGVAFVLHDEKTRLLLDTILNNRRKNVRLGLAVEQPQYSESLANVTQKEGGL